MEGYDDGRGGSGGRAGGTHKFLFILNRRASSIRLHHEMIRPDRETERQADRRTDRPTDYVHCHSEEDSKMNNDDKRWRRRWQRRHRGGVAAGRLRKVNFFRMSDLAEGGWSRLLKPQQTGLPGHKQNSSTGAGRTRRVWNSESDENEAARPHDDDDASITPSAAPFPCLPD